MCARIALYSSKRWLRAGKDGERRELEEPGHRRKPSVGTLETHPANPPMATASPQRSFPSLPPILCATLSHRGWITPFCVARCELQNARFAFCALNTDAHRRQSPESLKTGDCRREMEVMAITPPLRPIVREKQNVPCALSSS